MEGLVFTLTLVLVCTSTVHATNPPVKALDFDLSKPYNEFFQKIRTELAAGDTNLVENHVVLPPTIDSSQPPRRWIKVNIAGQGEDRASLFFRDDNLYLLAFANKMGKVHHTKGSGSLFPDSIALPFHENYPELTGKGQLEEISDVLKTVPFGHGEAVMAAKALSMYEQGKTPEKAAKRAILTFCLMIAEALRFRPIEATCTENWPRGTTAHFTEVQAQYIGNWRNLSYLLCRRDQGNPWTKYKHQMERMEIHNAKELAAILDLVFWVKECDKKKPLLMH